MREWAGRRREGRKPVPARVPLTRRTVRGQLSRTAGGGTSDTRDPVSAVTENFHQTFDSIGRRRARALTEEQYGGTGEAADGRRSAGRRPEAGGGQTSMRTEDLYAPGSAGGGTMGSPGRGTVDSLNAEPMDGGAGQERQPGTVMPESGIPLEKFSETAFRRGTLSASVLGGTGKMMLVSCLKRTAGQTGPNLKAEESLFDTGSQTRNVPGHSPDKMVFNRGFTDSAVGLVVDTLRDARRTVESLREMALGTGELRRDVEGSTLFRMYPFLDDRRERELLAEYETRLGENPEAGERAILQNGLVHVRAMLDRKASMREEFINKLRHISDCAEQALEEFQAPGFAEEVWQAAAELEPEDLPPEGGGEPPEDGGPLDGGEPLEDGGPLDGGGPLEDGEPLDGGGPPEDGGPLNGGELPEDGEPLEDEGPLNGGEVPPGDGEP